MKVELLSAGVDVYRVIKPKMTYHIPDGALYPTWEALVPSTEDKRHTPVRVSVWDSRKTTAQQAVDMRNAASGENSRQQPDDFYVFSMSTSDVEQASKKYKNDKLRVVSDPDGIPPSIATMPGVDGHAGIEGLDLEKGQPKPSWKSLLSDLAACCKLVSVT